MARTLLLRGMLVGLTVGLIVFAFARWIGEPYVERAIAFEARMDSLKGDPPESEMVSRRVQKSFGLLTGVAAYGIALGGIFGLTFAFAQGRLNRSRPRVLSLLLAALGFVTVILVPSLKYPPDPPSVGNHETIGIRTAAYFLIVTISLAMMTLSIKGWKYWRKSWGNWNAALLAFCLYVVSVSIFARFLPVIDEVPAEFPASLLWNFRIASWEIQAVMWSGLGLLFGWLTERAEDGSRRYSR